MAGLCAEYLLAKGWTAPAIYMLQTVVDKRIKGVAVAMFLFVSTVVASFSATTMGSLTGSLGYDPRHTPHEYGNLLAIITITPCAISIPCFLVAGCKFKSIQAEKDAKDGDITVEDVDGVSSVDQADRRLLERTFNRFEAYMSVADLDALTVHGGQAITRRYKQ